MRGAPPLALTHARPPRSSRSDLVEAGLLPLDRVPDALQLASLITEDPPPKVYFSTSPPRICPPGAPAPPCEDAPTPDGFSCAQQRDWGKCGAIWMVEGGFCKSTCGACAPPCEDFLSAGDPCVAANDAAERIGEVPLPCAPGLTCKIFDFGAPDQHLPDRGVCDAADA